MDIGKGKSAISMVDITQSHRPPSHMSSKGTDSGNIPPQSMDEADMKLEDQFTHEK